MEEKEENFDYVSVREKQTADFLNSIMTKKRSPSSPRNFFHILAIFPSTLHCCILPHD